jgi:hypothetical protein
VTDKNYIDNNLKRGRLVKNTGTLQTKRDEQNVPKKMAIKGIDQ